MGEVWVLSRSVWLIWDRCKILLGQLKNTLSGLNNA